MKRAFAAFLIVTALLITACAGGQGGGQGTVGGGLQIKTTTLPNWEAGNKATFRVEVTGGTPPYSFKIGAGSLPPSFTLGPDGTIGGTGTLSPGTSKSVSPPFTVVVTDSKGAAAQQSYSIKIVEPGISINTLTATCTVNQRCDQPIATASGGDAPYTFQSDTFAEGAPPFGMIVDVNGHILGTSKREGTFTVGVCAKDTNGNSKCGHATVIMTKGTQLAGTWSGPYSETESSEYCILRNEGTFTFVITEKGDGTFSGSADETGSTTSAASTTGEGNCQTSGGYHLAGTISGTIVGDALSGTIYLASEGSYVAPFSATLNGDLLTGSYTATGTFPDIAPTSVSGSFNLNKK